MRLKYKKDSVKTNAFLSILDRRGFIWELLLGFMAAQKIIAEKVKVISK